MHGRKWWYDHVMATARAHPRYALEIDAEIRASGERIPARTRNISHGGLSMEVARAVAAGQVVTITIALVFGEEKMSEPLPLRGRVVWCTEIGERRFQIGVTFMNLTGDDRAYVELFLRYLDA
jgi:Tfp pilus assembly protein PilZ